MRSLSALTERLLSRGPSDPGSATEGPRAAVAAILRDGQDGRPEVFFIVRAEHPSDPWSGHVAFPGGRRDPEDDHLLATAIRETREEVGLELGPEHVLTRLPDVPAFLRSRTKTGLVVTPFVFVLPRADAAIVPNEEVAKTLWVPLEVLAAERGKASFELPFEGQSYTMPCLYLAPGNHRLWGLTYRMLETLIEAATP